MLQVPLLKPLKQWRFLFLFLCLLGVQNSAQAQDKILVVDIAYELLAALGEYEELRTLEKKNHRSLNAKVIPVLQVILQQYQHQYDTLQTLTQHFEDPAPLQKRLKKMAYFIDLFKDELTYRKTMLDYKKAMQKQHRLMEEQ